MNKNRWLSYSVLEETLTEDLCVRYYDGEWHLTSLIYQKLADSDYIYRAQENVISRKEYADFIYAIKEMFHGA